MFRTLLFSEYLHIGIKKVSQRKEKPHKQRIYAICGVLYTTQTRKVWFAFDCFNTVIYTILY